MTSLVLTVIGHDRPGIVEALSETVESHGGSWLESRMSRLGGRFTGLLRVSVADEHAQNLASALGKLESRGLQIIVQSSGADEPIGVPRVLRLELIGQDHPGIVRQLSQALSSRQVNVEELETRVSSAPMSGESLFHASASLLVPSDAALDELREALEKIANELMVDLSFDEPA